MFGKDPWIPPLPVPELSQAHSADVQPVQENLALVQLHHTKQGQEQGGLSGAGASHDAHLLPGSHRQADPVQGVGEAGPVGQNHAAELQAALSRPCRRQLEREREKGVREKGVWEAESGKQRAGSGKKESCKRKSGKRECGKKDSGKRRAGSREVEAESGKRENGEPRGLNLTSVCIYCRFIVSVVRQSIN